MITEIISVAYGTVTPCYFGYWAKKDDKWVLDKEIYYDAREAERQLTDSELANFLSVLSHNKKNTMIILEVSSASFGETVGRLGWKHDYVLPQKLTNNIPHMYDMGDSLYSHSETSKELKEKIETSLGLVIDVTQSETKKHLFEPRFETVEDKIKKLENRIKNLENFCLQLKREME